MTLFLDLDEVLADFVGGVADLYGLDRAELIQLWPIGEWDVTTPLLARFPNYQRDNLYRDINRIGESFWAGLNKLQWFNSMVRLANYYTNSNWNLITSPFQHWTSYAGKARWVFDRFGTSFARRLFITSQKHLFAKPGAILIDDCEANIQRWQRHGGEGILFPAHHNSLHAEKDNPLYHVSESLSRFQSHKEDLVCSE